MLLSLLVYMSTAARITLYWQTCQSLWVNCELFQKRSHIPFISYWHSAGIDSRQIKNAYATREPPRCPLTGEWISIFRSIVGMRWRTACNVVRCSWYSFVDVPFVCAYRNVTLSVALDSAHLFLSSTCTCVWPQLEGCLWQDYLHFHPHFAPKQGS